MASKSPTRKTNKTFSFATLKAEARRGKTTEFTPFVMNVPEGDDIVIAPMDSERYVDFMDLLDPTGSIRYRDYRQALRIMCDDAYEQVWELLRHEGHEVMAEVVTAIAKHLTTPVERDAAALPGGTEAFSNS